MNDTLRINWLEAMVDEGACPGLINDDAGRWAVSFIGIQNVSSTMGSEPIDIVTTFFIDAEEWKATIREAIDWAMASKGE